MQSYSPLFSVHYACYNKTNYPLHKQDSDVLNQKSYDFPMSFCQMPKRKGESLFHVASKCFWGRINCNEVSKFSVWSLFFKAGVPLPAPQLGQFIWLHLPMVPSVHTLHGKTVRDIKETVFGKGRLGWGVAETCSLTLAPLISVHSRWINTIYFKQIFPFLSSVPHHHLDGHGW